MVTQGAQGVAKTGAGMPDTSLLGNRDAREGFPEEVMPELMLEG